MKVLVWASDDGCAWTPRHVVVSTRAGAASLTYDGARFGALCDVHSGSEPASDVWLLCERVARDENDALACDGLCSIGSAQLPVRLPVVLVRVHNGGCADVDHTTGGPAFTMDHIVDGASPHDDASRSELARIATLARTLESASLLTGRSGNESGNSFSGDGMECASVMSE